LKSKTEEDEPEPIATPGQVWPETIFEQLADGEFLVYDRATGECSTKMLVCQDGQGYSPLPRIPWPAACVPSVEDCSEEPKTKEQLIEAVRKGRFQGEYGDPERLFNEVRDFFVDHLDLRNELLYDVYAAFVLMSWRIEDFKVVPYVFFLGPLASGKTRGLECFKFLGYRAIMAASMSAATIFRTLETWHCLLLLDETEIYGRESMIEVLALLNSGYRRGQFAIRIEKLDGKVPQIAMFDTFGAKVLAGTEELAATLQSRAILTTMSRNVRRVRLFVDEERAQELRNKLLIYRFRNLGCKSEFDVSTLNGYFCNSRVIELFVSLLEVAPTQEVRDRLVQCMWAITQTREEEEAASVEARVFEALLKCESELEAGKVSTQTITQSFNADLPEREQATSRFIGRKVAGLGFEKCRVGSRGRSGFFWDLKLIERLKARYGRPSKTTSETPVTSETTVGMEGQHSQTKLETVVTEEKPPVTIAPTEGSNTVKTEVSEQTEVTEVSLEVLAPKVQKLERLTGVFEDKCVLCGEKGRMDWQATEHDGTWALLCGDCGDELGKRLNNHDCAGAADPLS
jgi:hypothetical protein